jgi:hypothetical protein
LLSKRFPDERHEKNASWQAKFSNILLTGGVVYCLSFFAYSLYNTVHYSIANIHDYAISLVGIGLFAAGLCLREEWKVNIALIMVSIGISVYAVEFCLASLSSQSITMHAVVGPRTMREAAVQREAAALQLGIPFDFRSKYEILMALRERGVKAYPHIPVSALISSDGLVMENGARLFPLAGISYGVTVYCNESGEYIIYRSDEHGFNNPEKIYTPGDVEIVLIGDSFAEGACVPPEENLAGQLRKKGHRVLNFGQGGSGPLFQLAVLTEYAAPLRPPMVLWLYYEGNDLGDLERESKSPLLTRYLDDSFSQGLIGRQDEIDHLLKAYVEEEISSEQEERDERMEEGERDKREEKWEEREREVLQFNSFPWRILKLQHLRSRFSSFLPPPSVSLFRTVLEKAKVRVAAWGGQLFFVYLPEWKRYANKVNEYSFHHRRHTLSLVNALDIPVIDFHEAIVSYHDSLAIFPLRMHGHYNTDGYKLLSLYIEASLRSTDR